LGVTPRRAVRLLFAAASVLSLATPEPLAGQARPAIGMDEAVAIAMRENPDMVLARLRMDSAHGERRIARALPALSVGAVPQVPYQYTVSAPLDVGPQRIYRTRAAGAGARAAGQDALDARRQVVFAVRSAFEDVLLSEAQREVARERQDIVRQLLAADSARLRGGDVPARDVVRTEVELARADADLARADALVHEARLALELLLGVDRPDTAFAVRGDLAYRPVPIPTDSLTGLAEQHRPDLRAARERTEQSRALFGLAGAELFPTPTLSLVYQRGTPFDNGSNYALGIGLSLPLLYWNGGERERGRAGMEAAGAVERRTRAAAANDVQTALDAWRAARGLAERYEGGLLARSQAALETSRYAYRAGAASLLELLDAIRVYADVRTDYSTAVHDYWVSVFALARATGTEFTP
jgi:outer membrane protein TolC